MKAALFLFVLVLALSGCSTTSPAARNTLPNHRALTETTTPETAEPSRPPRPDTSAIPPKPQD
jgi:predicted component of type VI protein secretion system